MNIFKWDANDAEPLVGTIRLLYRPGHYDILYKADDIPVKQQTPQIHRVAYADPTFTATPAFRYLDLSEGDYWPPAHIGIPPWTGYPSNGSYISESAACPAPHAQPTAHPTLSPQAAPPVSNTSHGRLQQNQARPYFTQASHTSHLATTSSSVAPTISAFSPTIHKSEDPFRKSPWDLKFAATGSGDLPFRGIPKRDPCTTEAMLKSGEGKNHYRNPDFEPEAYDPDKEERPERGQGNGNGGSSRGSVSSRSPRSGKASRRGSNH